MRKMPRNMQGGNNVAPDMKETIAQAAKSILLERNVKKLTVKDIVEVCQITRQAFYYHFEDIPALMKSIMNEAFDELIEQQPVFTTLEECIKATIKFIVQNK